MKPAILIALVVVLLIGTLGVIVYVQRTLSDIEEALPIRLSRQERDIRLLVDDMDRLVQNIGYARNNLTPGQFDLIVQQTDEIAHYLETIRSNHRFNDLLGISAIHARLNPAIFDIRSWLAVGIYNIGPKSAVVLGMAEHRARYAHREAEALLQEVEKRAIGVLDEQANRISAFRSIMIVTLVALTLMTLGLILLGLRLQRIVFALKDSEEQIRYRANYDSLTNLPNRPNFIEHLSEAISRCRRHGDQAALLFIDLDRFKTINDTLGHDFGDELIRQVALRIHQEIRETDMVARLGGDEFTVLLTDMKDQFQASMVAKDIIARLSQPFTLFGHDIHTGASIGITVCPDDGLDSNTLLKNADMAMYEAKDQGRNTFRFFTRQMTEQARQFLELDKDMRRAMVQREFDLCFQPIFDLATPAPKGVEALLRWQHPVKGLILPGEFVMVAEETGLIDEIGLWVLKQACKQALPWLEQDVDDDFYLAVNISMRQFKGGFNARQLTGILDKTGFPAERLVLEITESLLMDNDTRTRNTLNEIRQLGVGLAVDDFGTGYSALSYLREFPVNTLKIDRSFVRDIASKSSDRRLVEAIVVMSHGLGLVVVAEGVETLEQDVLLRDLNCNMVQGNYYSRPMSAEDIAALLSDGTTRRILSAQALP